MNEGGYQLNNSIQGFPNLTVKEITLAAYDEWQTQGGILATEQDIFQNNSKLQYLKKYKEVKHIIEAESNRAAAAKAAAGEFVW